LERFAEQELCGDELPRAGCREEKESHPGRCRQRPASKDQGFEHGAPDDDELALSQALADQLALAVRRIQERLADGAPN